MSVGKVDESSPVSQSLAGEWGRWNAETGIGPQWASQGVMVVSVELELGFISSSGTNLYSRNCSEKVDFQ